MRIPLSDWVENIVGKWEIACYKQFLLFPTMFSKAVFYLLSQNEYLWSKGLSPTIHQWAMQDPLKLEENSSVSLSDKKNLILITKLLF